MRDFSTYPLNDFSSTVFNCIREVIWELLTKLPNDSRVLVVGAHAAAEIKRQARYFPEFLFRILDHKEDRLKLASEVLENSMFAINYELMLGKVESLSQEDRYHAIFHFDLDVQAVSDEIVSNPLAFKTLLHEDGVLIFGLRTNAQDAPAETVDVRWMSVEGSPLRQSSHFSSKMSDEVLLSSGLPPAVLFFQFLHYQCWFAHKR